MSLWQSLLITLLRSLVVALVALPLCRQLSRGLRSSQRGRWLAWWLLLLPIVAPKLVTGFGYANFSLSLVPYPIWNELFYGLLLLVSVVPIGTVISHFAPPPPLSREALFCARLVRGHRPNVGEQPKFQLPLRDRLPPETAATSIMFLLAFQEFELASLLGVASWTVWLFDAHAGGLLLTESLRYTIMPLACELLILAITVSFVWRDFGKRSAAERFSAQQSTAAVRVLWSYGLLTAVVFCLVPWSFVLQSAWSGWSQLNRNPMVLQETLAGSLVACLAAAMAYATAMAWLHDRQRAASASSAHARQGLRGPLVRWGLPMFGLPGMLGSLVLGLCTLFLFQTDVLQWCYSTPVPWTLGLILFLLPRAMLLILLLGLLRTPEARYLTQLLSDSPVDHQRYQARDLEWHGKWAFHLLAFACLFFWGYGDLTIASILSPPGIVSAPVRLYNLMHYGQSAVLAAMVIVAFGIPSLIVATCVLFRRPLQRGLLS